MAQGRTLADRTVGLEEVRLEEGLKQVAGDALDGVVDREDVDALAVLDIRARVDRDDVAEADTQVASDDCVQGATPGQGGTAAVGIGGRRGRPADGSPH